jgi:hypothetical protein
LQNISSDVNKTVSDLIENKVITKLCDRETIIILYKSIAANIWICILF